MMPDNCECCLLEIGDGADCKRSRYDDEKQEVVPGSQCPFVLLAAKERECERLLEYIAQFVVMDDVGDDTFVLGPIVRDEEFADSLFRHIAPPIRNEETYNPYHDNEPKQVIRRAALAEGGGE